jgi:hypothetical protein
VLRYATGRERVVLDRPQVDSIVRAMMSPDAGLHELVELLVLSGIFRNNSCIGIKRWVEDNE